MASRFSPNRKKKKTQRYHAAAAIIPADDDDHEEDNDTISLTKSAKKLSKKRSKKGQSSTKQSYVMINTSYNHFDTDEEDDELTDSNSPKHTLSHTNGTTTQQMAEDSHTDDEDSTISELEEVELCGAAGSKRNNDTSLMSVDIDHSITDTTDLHFGNKHGNDGNKYGLSAYYGARLNYKESQHTCHDMGWSIFWIIHCIAVIIISIIVWTSDHVHMPHASNGLFILLFLLAFAVIFSFAWTFLLKYCGGYICWILIIGNLIFMAAFASFCFIVGDRFTGIGVLFSILFACFAFFTLLIRKKINYTIALLQLGSSIVLTTPSALMVSFGVLVVQILWMFIWGSIVVAWMAQFYHTNSSSDFTGILFILILSFIWNHQVIKNIGHTTICAITAHWYFNPDSSYPTCKALCRCLTTSLGSIVFGSLFVNVLQGLRAFVRVVRDGGCCCACGKGCLTCCLSGCEGLLEYFNTYAFVHVAVYDTAYLKSGKNTFDLLSISSVYELINSNFTEYALLCGSICGGIVNGILASWIANAMQFKVDWVVLFTCGGFMIGMSLSSSLLNAISSCVVALFVCYAEEPNVLIELHPEQHLRFDGAKKGIA
eukprot:34780_1